MSQSHGGLWVQIAAVGRLMYRLLPSPSLVAIGLYETLPPIGWHHAFVIGWSKYRLGLHNAPFHYELTWPVGIPAVFQTPVTVPMHSLCGRQYLPLGLCKGIVKENKMYGEVFLDETVPRKHLFIQISINSLWPIDAMWYFNLGQH